METIAEIVGEMEDMGKRDSTFPVKMSRDEIKLLKERANRFGMSAGAYLRFLFHREIQSRKQEDFSITRKG